MRLPQPHRLDLKLRARLLRSPKRQSSGLRQPVQSLLQRSQRRWCCGRIPPLEVLLPRRLLLSLNLSKPSRLKQITPSIMCLLTTRGPALLHHRLNLKPISTVSPLTTRGQAPLHRRLSLKPTSTLCLPTTRGQAPLHRRLRGMLTSTTYPLITRGKATIPRRLNLKPTKMCPLVIRGRTQSHQHRAMGRRSRPSTSRPYPLITQERA